MEDNKLERNCFQHNVTTNQLIFASFTRYLRNRTVWDKLLIPPRFRPITGLYINSLLSHAKKWMELRDPVIASNLRSSTTAGLITAYVSNDHIIRGPLDAYKHIPFGPQFVLEVLKEIDVVFRSDPAARSLYRTLVLCEFGFGSRVNEFIDKDQGESPELSPESSRPVLNHAARCDDIAMQWTEGGKWLKLSEYSQFPAGTPQVATVFHDHTKNHPEGTLPISIWANPIGPTPFCVLTDLREYARLWHTTMIPHEKLFSSAKDTILRQIVKTVAVRVGFNPRRCQLRGFRSGNCTATTPDAFNDPGKAAANAQDAYSGWAQGGSKPYARGNMAAGQMKSLAIYDLSINTINDGLHRYMRFEQRAVADVHFI